MLCSPVMFKLMGQVLLQTGLCWVSGQGILVGMGLVPAFLGDTGDEQQRKQGPQVSAASQGLLRL